MGVWFSSRGLFFGCASLQRTGVCLRTTGLPGRCLSAVDRLLKDEITEGGSEIGDDNPKKWRSDAEDHGPVVQGIPVDRVPPSDVRNNSTEKGVSWLEERGEESRRNSSVSPESEATIKVGVVGALTCDSGGDWRG